MDGQSPPSTPRRGFLGSGTFDRRLGRNRCNPLALSVLAFAVATTFTSSRLLLPVPRTLTGANNYPDQSSLATSSGCNGADGIGSNNNNNDGDDDLVRVVALCTCCVGNSRDCTAGDNTLDAALKTMSELIPQISYAGMHQMIMMEGETAIMKTTADDPPLSSSCDEHAEQYTRELLSEMKLDASNTTTVVEVIYTPGYGEKCKAEIRPLNESIAGLSRTRGGNENLGVGLHVPPMPTHHKRHLRDWGEVFINHAKKESCSLDSNTIHTYRSRKLEPHQYDNCPVIHYPTIIRWAESIRLHRIETGDSPSNETTLSLLSRRRSREEARRILASKEHFCVIVTRTTMTPRYQADGLIRHALSRLLTKKYKPCLGLQRWIGGVDKMKEYNLTTDTGPWNTYAIQRPFKFVIAMANEMSEGYLVEKTIHPYLVGSVGISMTPDVGKYVNANSLVSCRLSRDEVDKVQRYYRGEFQWMPFNTTPEMWTNDSNIQPITHSPYTREKDGVGDEPALEFVTSQWEEALMPCVDEIAALDRDDNAYVEKLMEPYLLNDGRRSLFDGTYLAISLLHWYSFVGSPLVRSLRIEGVEGMLEQTPGWGVP